MRRYAGKELITKFILENKRGKCFEHLHGKFGVKPEQLINRAIALKYQTYLSRCKYKFVCKIQSSTFDIENQKWCKNIISYGDRTINICDKTISTYKISKFLESLDIGDINTTPGHCGASRSVTALTTMIIHLNIRIPELRNNLMWFNGVENHFIMQFADDGAPESRDRSMSIGTLSCWNLGGRIRSREYQYFLHTINCSEKDDVMAALWKQHTEEMMLIEDSVLHIFGQKIIVEYQPSADQACQFCANNELTQSATYPSMFANVHKGELNVIGGTLGVGPDFTWQVPTLETTI